MARAYDVSKLLKAATALLNHLDAASARNPYGGDGPLRQHLEDAISDTKSEISHLERDGVPTLYVSEDGSTSTHRMQSSDIRVWCATAEDGHRLMTVIDLLGERKHHFCRPMFRTGGAQ